MGRRRRPEVPGGLALIVVVGVLGVLAALSVAFVVMSQLERKAAAQRVFASRAQLLARSGVEDALARLGQGQDPAYAGEDWNANGILDGLEVSAQVLDRARLNREDCPARDALRPSFYARDPLSPGAPKSPLLRKVDGYLRGYTGGLSGERASDGNLYAVRVDDESAKINVNGGLLDVQDRDGDGIPDCRDPDVRTASASDCGRGWNGQLRRVLNLLGQQAEVALPGLGTLALQARPPGGYGSIRELQAALGTPKDLSPFLTTVSWVDRKVIHPNAWDGQGSAWTGMAEIIESRKPLGLEEGGRPPVNLNAASRPVLLALLQDLKGKSWQDATAPFSYALDAAKAGLVADRILASRPFASWNAFAVFCDGLVPTALSGYEAGRPWGGGNLCAADLIKANFDPNSMLNKTLPDQLMWRWIDKSDLINHSTEGALGSTGVYQVASVGRVVDRHGRLMAEARFAMVIQSFALLRQTTQKDFVGGRSLAALPTYLSLSTDAINQATGAGASWNPSGGGAGVAAMTYPCPPTALPGNAAEVDGCLGLATLEMKSAVPPGAVSVKFLHHFDDSWAADLGNPASLKAGTSEGSLLQTDLTRSSYPAAPTRPNTLCPDGVYEQYGRSPTYQASGNLPADLAPGRPVGGANPGDRTNHGVVNYWAKPMTQRPVCYDFCCYRMSGPLTQILAIGRKQNNGWGGVLENSPADDGMDSDRERIAVCLTGQTLPGGRWHMVTVFLDTDEVVDGKDLCMWVRDVHGTFPSTEYYPTFDTSLSEDITRDGAYFLFGSPTGNAGTPSPVSQMVDEFAILDFSNDAAAALGALAPWALGCYRDGRYYKENDGTFASSVLAPEGGAPVRLLRAEWTAYLPKESRLEIEYGNPPAGTGTPRATDPTLTDARIEVELLDSTGGLLQTLVQGASIGRSAGSFGYRVRFLPTPTWTPIQRQNQPVLETPFFDDITFFYQPQGGLRVLGASLR